MYYSILRYGAVADGVTNCAAAIQQAVDAAAAAGGGRVIVPAGRFLSGSVLLKDNVELHLESGAVLISSLNPADITPFPQGGDGTDPDDTADGWEGGFFLGASHAKNVTISGMVRAENAVCTDTMEDASAVSSLNLAENILIRAAGGALAAMTVMTVRRLSSPNARQTPSDSRGNATSRSSMDIHELMPCRAARKSAWLS